MMIAVPVFAGLVEVVDNETDDDDVLHDERRHIQVELVPQQQAEGQERGVHEEQQRQLVGRLQRLGQRQVAEVGAAERHHGEGRQHEIQAGDADDGPVEAGDHRVDALLVEEDVEHVHRVEDVEDDSLREDVDLPLAVAAGVGVVQRHEEREEDDRRQRHRELERVRPEEVHLVQLPRKVLEDDGRPHGHHARVHEPREVAHGQAARLNGRAQHGRLAHQAEVAVRNDERHQEDEEHADVAGDPGVPVAVVVQHQVVVEHRPLHHHQQHADDARRDHVAVGTVGVRGHVVHPGRVLVGLYGHYDDSVDIFMVVRRVSSADRGGIVSLKGEVTKININHLVVNAPQCTLSNYITTTEYK